MIQKEENNLQFLYKNPHPHKVTSETDMVIQDTEFGFKCGVLQVTDSAVPPRHPYNSATARPPADAKGIAGHHSTQRTKKKGP